jgi:hypothetical protein
VDELLDQVGGETAEEASSDHGTQIHVAEAGIAHLTDRRLFRFHQIDFSLPKPANYPSV